MSTATGPLGFEPTSGTEEWVPAADRQWDQIAPEVLPGLWLGGQVCQPTGGTCQPGSDFDAVYSMTSVDPSLLPGPEVPHWTYLLDDIEVLEPCHYGALYAIATDVLLDLAAHQRVLVRCWAGYNRSALVVALVLVLSGCTPRQAIETMRARRSPHVLSNRTFERWLLTQDGTTDADDS